MSALFFVVYFMALFMLWAAAIAIGLEAQARREDSRHVLTAVSEETADAAPASPQYHRAA